MTVQGLVIYNSAGFSCGLGLHHHSTAPLDWLIDRDFLKYSKANVSVKAPFYSFLPVEWDLCRGVYSYWFGGRVNMEP